MALHKRWQWAAIAAVLLFYFLALDSLTGDSPTMDEQNHIARGLAYLRTGDPRLSVEHPPLVNAISALPLLTMPEIDLPLDDASWQRTPPDVFWYVFAEKLLWELNRDLDMQQIFFLARLPVVYLALGLALAGWRFAQQMWGGSAPFWALLFLLFDPNILAHGRYVTTDVGGALFLLVATLLLWQLWRQETWSWQRLAPAALGMGLAFAAKLSNLVFLPIWLLLALLPLYGGAPHASLRAALRRVGELLTAGAASLAVVWLIYGLQWGSFLFLDARFSVLNRFSGPMPTFWSGIERILLVSEGGRPSFLMGEFSNQGFALYFPLAFAVKTPLLTIAFFLAAAVLLLLLPRTRASAVFLLLPLLGYFAISTLSALNIGYRHLLPILPFLYLLIAGLASPAVAAWLGERFGPRPSLTYAPAAALFLLVLSLLAVDLQIHPHYLSTFNSLAGGPANGHRLLVDSNIDWGQDLLRLRAWAAANEIDDLRLGWFGTADPDYYGLAYTPLPGFPRQPFYGQWSDPPFDPGAPPAGTYAISVSALWELPLQEKDVYAWFRAREPDERIGYSIHIYQVP